MNLGKLFTKEDKFHFHKVVGVVAVAQYCARFFHLVMWGDMALRNSTALYALALHGALSATSFMFHISNVRHARLPIIYPEFRAHSAIFSARSIVCTLCFYYNAPLWWNMAACVVTMLAADAATAYYKEKTTTMRNMPAGDGFTPAERTSLRRMHSFMQFVATYYMLGTIDTAYSPIFAIQCAALLMTLVKKSIISPAQWHLYYSLTLWANIFTILSAPTVFFFEMNAAAIFYDWWRIKCGYNKYIGWGVVFVARACGARLLGAAAAYESVLPATEIKMVIIIAVLCHFSRKYMFLFERKT